MSRARVLLVDDDLVFNDLMARGFGKRGFEVAQANSAAEAVRQALQFQPSHIVLDLNMPGGSGLLALPELVDAAPTARIVVLTGFSSIATTVEAIKRGACNYLCKPATIAEVLTAFEDSSPVVPGVDESAPPSVERLEWEYIQRVLNDNDNNISATARSLGMHRRTLQRKLLKRPVKR